MTQDEIIRSIIAEKLVCDISEVTDEKSLVQDLGADSLDKVEIDCELEKRFGIFISDDDIETLKTVGDVVSHVNEKIKNKLN